MSELQAELQRLSGTTLDAQGAANDWAETTGLDLVGALNTKAGIARADWLDLEGVLNRLAGTTGLGSNAAAALIGLGYGLVLPGTAGNYASSPDSVLNSVTGDLDLRVCVALDDWTPAARQFLIGKWTGGAGLRSYAISVQTNGTLETFLSQDGSTTITGAGNAPGFADGATGWIRWTVDVDDGAGNRVQRWYSSIDGVTWTLLNTSTVAGVISIFDSATTALSIGARDVGTVDPLAGTVYYAEVRNGIDGEVVAKFDTSTVISTGAMLPATLNGWTVNGSAVKKYEDYVRLPGTSGNYLSFPDTVANSVTGDLDLRCKVSLDDWTPAATQLLMAKQTSGDPNRVFIWRVIASTGVLELAWYPAGTGASIITKGSTVAVPASDGAPIWVRSTLAVSTGQVAHYTSSDGVTWAALGTLPSAAGATSLPDTTDPIHIGARNAGGTVEPLAGNVYAAQVRSGIDGTVVASFDARDITTPWTINGVGWNWESSSPLALADMALSLTGAASNYASTPDSAAQTVTDFDLRAKVTMTNWASGTTQRIISKEVPSTQRSYGLGVSASGLLMTRFSVDGTVSYEWGSTSSPGFAAGSTHWARVTRVASTGTIQFFISDDGVAWTKLGGDVAGVTGAPFDSTSAIEIGVRAGTNEPMNGKVHYAAVHAGIDGPIVARFDPSAVARTGVRLPATLTQPGGTPNLLTPNQASLETDTTGWAALTNCTIARSTAQFLDGAASLAITATGVGSTIAKTPDGTAGIPVVAGKSYIAAASFRGATTGRAVQLYLYWWTAAGVQISNPNASGTDVTTGWTAVTTAGLVAPATAAFASLRAMVNDATQLATEVHYVDRISLVEAPTVWTLNGAAWDWVDVT